MNSAGPLILDRAAIAAVLPNLDLVEMTERAFVAYSEGRCQVATVGELLFEEPPGEAHIKAGHLAGAPVFAVKVATGFYENPRRGLPSSSGLVLLFDANTGEPNAILLDEGSLTDERTAAAGAVAAKHLAPANLDCIGILGAGTQGQLQLAHLRSVTACRRAMVWARRPEAGEAFARRAEGLGFEVVVAPSPRDLALATRLIVTTTPAVEPLLSAADIAPGTHITAVGADTPQKAEIAADLVARADRLFADSRIQSRDRGEFRRAPLQAPIAEIGEVIQGGAAGRSSAAEITIADLTGVAIQDAAIAAAVFAAVGHGTRR